MSTSQRSDAAFACGMAIHACLAALAHQLADAQHLAADARSAMERGELNLALGSIMPLEQRLPECEVLVHAVLSLKSWRNSMPSQTEVVTQGASR